MTDYFSKPDQNSGCSYQITWFGAGFVLPFYSLEFYLNAIRKPLRSSLLFFVVLMTLAAALTTGRVSRAVESFRLQADQAYRSGDIPVIIIRDGVASVEGQDPFIISDADRFFIAVDTTGDLDREALLKYNGGILITKTTHYTYGDGRYQAVDLANYNLGFSSDAVVFDEEIIGAMLTTLPSLILGSVALLTWLWNVAAWLLFLAISAYFLWGPIHQVLTEFPYRAVLSIGIYAHLPAFTINHILTLFGVQTMFIYTTLLLVFWVGALYLVLNAIAGEIFRAQLDELPKQLPTQPAPSPPRLWPAWLGLPVVVFIAANAIYSWEFAPLVVLGSTALTIAVLLFIDSRQHPQPEKKPEAE